MYKRSEQHSGMCCFAPSRNLSVSPDRQEWTSGGDRCHGPSTWLDFAGEEGVGEPQGRGQETQWPGVERHEARPRIGRDVKCVFTNK
jgi:hypothetical protein